MRFTFKGQDVPETIPARAAEVADTVHMSVEEYKTLVADIERLEDEKKRLMEIPKRKENAERGLHPRKEHPGVVVTGIREVTYSADWKPKSGRERERRRHAAMEYTLQTGYRFADCPAPGLIRQKALADVITGLGLEWFGNIESRAETLEKRLEQLLKADGLKQWGEVFKADASPFLLGWRLVSGRTSPYWEVIAVVSQEVDVPPDLFLTK